jgi:hypothetical protein
MQRVKFVMKGGVVIKDELDVRNEGTRTSAVR